MSNIQKMWDQQWQITLTKPHSQVVQWNKVVSMLKITPKVFLDIGVGGFGSEAWEVIKTHPGCKIIGFEPQPERYQSLRQHNYPGILFPYVISDVEGMVKGYMGYKGGKSDFWLFGGDDQPAGAYREVDIMSYTLDELEVYCGSFNDAFIWADVEGSELAVLRGAGRLFDEEKIVGVNVELRSNPIRTGVCTAGEVNEFLRSKKFERIGKLDITKGHRDVIFVRR